VADHLPEGRSSSPSSVQCGRESAVSWAIHGDAHAPVRLHETHPTFDEVRVCQGEFPPPYRILLPPSYTDGGFLQRYLRFKIFLAQHAGTQRETGSVASRDRLDRSNLRKSMIRADHGSDQGSSSSWREGMDDENGSMADPTARSYQDLMVLRSSSSAALLFIRSSLDRGEPSHPITLSRTTITT
jgi:hypothetical protein